MDEFDELFQGLASLFRNVLTELKALRIELSGFRAELRKFNNNMSNKKRPIPRRRTTKTKIEKNPRAQKLALELLSKGTKYSDVAAEINRKIKGFSTSRSSVGRFWASYQKEKALREN